MVVSAMKNKQQNRASMDVSLAQSQISATPESSDEIPTGLAEWRPRGEIVVEGMNKKGKLIRKFLRQEAMTNFLDQVREGHAFQFRGMQTSEDFAYPEFGLAVKWLTIRGLIEKAPGGYVIKSIDAIRRAWNTELTDAVKI